MFRKTIPIVVLFGLCVFETIVLGDLLLKAIDRSLSYDREYYHYVDYGAESHMRMIEGLSCSRDDFYIQLYSERNGICVLSGMYHKEDPYSLLNQLVEVNDKWQRIQTGFTGPAEITEDLIGYCPQFRIGELNSKIQYGYSYIDISEETNEAIIAFFEDDHHSPKFILYSTKDLRQTRSAMDMIIAKLGESEITAY